MATRISTPAANLCVGISSIWDHTQISASEIEDRVVAENFIQSAGKVTQVPSHVFPIWQIQSTAALALLAGLLSLGGGVGL